jgi:hypothetical protein
MKRCRTRPKLRRRSPPKRPAVAPVRFSAVQAAELGALLKFWGQLWPFGTDLFSFFGSNIPVAVMEAFPRLGPESETMFALYDLTLADDRAVAEGQNPRFERAVADLAPLGIPRAELIRRSSAEPLLSAYRWALAESAVVESLRPRVNAEGARLRRIRRILRAAPTRNPAGLAECELLLRWLTGIPNEGQLRTWRREIGLNRLGDDLWKLKFWIPLGAELAEYLRDKQTEARATDANLDRPQFAGRAAHALLYARYPGIVDADPLKLLHRINR